MNSMIIYGFNVKVAEPKGLGPQNFHNSVRNGEIDIFMS